MCSLAMLQSRSEYYFTHHFLVIRLLLFPCFCLVQLLPIDLQAGFRRATATPCTVAGFSPSTI